MKTIYGALWLGWVAYFLAVEFTAIGTGHDNYTLSDFVWRLEEINRTWTALRFALAAFCLWLLLHISLGWFR